MRVCVLCAFVCIRVRISEWERGRGGGREREREEGREERREGGRGREGEKGEVREGERKEGREGRNACMRACASERVRQCDVFITREQANNTRPHPPLSPQGIFFFCGLITCCYFCCCCFFCCNFCCGKCKPSPDEAWEDLSTYDDIKEEEDAPVFTQPGTNGSMGDADSAPKSPVESTASSSTATSSTPMQPAQSS